MRVRLPPQALCSKQTIPMKLTETKLRSIIREEMGEFYKTNGYKSFKQKVEGSLIELGEVRRNTLMLNGPGIFYEVEGDSIDINGQPVSGSRTFLDTGKRVGKVTMRGSSGKFASTESLFIEIGGITVKVREPRNFEVGMDRTY